METQTINNKTINKRNNNTTKKRKKIIANNPKDNIIAGILAFTIFINPFINFGRNNKTKNNIQINNNNYSTNHTINTKPTEELLPTEIKEEEIPSTTPNTNNIEETIEETIPPTTQTNNIIEEENNINDYINYIDSIETIYNHEEYYPTINEINKIIEVSHNNTYCNYQYNNDLNNLINQIKTNSNFFLESYPEFTSAFKSQETTNELIISDQKDFETKFEYILKNLIKYANNNINEDICIIKDLKIVLSYDNNEEYNSTSAYYSPNHNLIVIFPNNIRKNAELIGIDYYEYLESVLNHELNHTRQHLCNCQNNQTIKDINIKTLIEASAESEPYNLKKTSLLERYLSYPIERTHEALILTLGLFHDNKTTIDYYNAIFNSDLQALYDFCGAKTNEEIYELYKIFYAIDAINLKNDLIENYNYTNHKITSNDIKEIVGYDYRVDIFKNVLKNMITYTYNNNNFELKDNLVMLNIIKSLIVDEAYQKIESPNESTDYSYIYDQEFVLNIYDLENKYIEFLSNHYNTSINNIRNIEKNDIYWEFSAVFDICNEYDSQYIDFEYYEYANKLVERFPLLEAILSPNIIGKYQYTDFLTNNQITLVKNRY